MSLDWIVRIVQENGPMFLRGAWVTLYISIIGTLVGTLIGLVIGVIKTIPVPEKGVKRIILKIVNGILSAYRVFPWYTDDCASYGYLLWICSSFFNRYK